MRLTPFARRSAAIAAATALISSGGAVTGLLAGTAFAATVTSVSPSSWDNRSSVTLEIIGTGFKNASPDPAFRSAVVFKPANPDVAHEVGDFEVPVQQTIQSPNRATATINLSMAPTGQYRVVIKDPVDGESATPVDPNFTIYGYGSANVTGVAVGANGASADPLGLDCTYVSDCGRGAQSLDISGSNIAIGAKVDFLVKSGTTWVPDPGLSFAPGNPNNGENRLGTQDAGGTAFAHTGYPSTSLLQGNYAYTFAGTDPALPGKQAFTPGLHKLQVVNTDGKNTGTTVDFVQPWYAVDGISPSSVGVGSQAKTVTITGQGFRSGSTFAVASGGNQQCGTDVTVGAATLGGQVADGTYTTMSAPVSFKSCAPLTGRAVTIVSPDGARFTRTGILMPVAAPAFTELPAAYDTLGQGASVGYGSDGTWASGTGIQITGTNFAGASETDPAKMTSFSFGDGVTVVTRDIINSTTAEVTIDVSPEAATGERDAVATNPDGGSKTTTKASTPLATAPLTINAGPKITSVDPSGVAPSESTTVTVTGTFNTSDTYTVALSPSDPNLSVGLPVRTATTITFSVSTNGATPGPRTLTVTDQADHGRVVCTGCFQVDSLALIAQNGTPLVPGSDASAPNNSATPVVLTMEGAGLDTVTSSSTATLTRQVPLAGQGPITGSALTPGTTNRADASFNLLDAAPGKYNLTVVLDPSSPESAAATTRSCGGCVVVTGAPITVTNLTPNAGGQGVTNRTLTFTGTNFSHGISIVTDTSVAVHHVAFVDSTHLTAQVDVPADAPTGATTVTLTAGDGSTATTTFTVNAAPAFAASDPVAPVAYGQGAGTAGSGSTVKITVTGPGLDPAATADFGSGVVVTAVTVTQGTPTPIIDPNPDDTLEATVEIAQAAPTGKHTVTVTNPDGGTATLADGFTVNPGPKVLSLADETGAPALRPDGVEHTVTVVGSGFSTSLPTVVSFSPADGITLGVVTVDSANKITAKVTVATGAAKGARTVAVSHAGTQQSPGDFGYGSCATCAYVAVEPGIPASLALASGAKSLTATWTPPTSDGGAPITAYRLAYALAGVTTATVVDLPATARTYTITGLTNSATYNVSVTALNAVGKGGPRMATGVAGLPASLSLAVSTTKAIYGQRVLVSGTLTGTGGVALTGRTIVLAFYPRGAASYTRTVTTNSRGQYGYGIVSPYNVSVRAFWAGDMTTYRTAASVFRYFTVAARVLITSPANYSKSSASTVLWLSGTVSPNKSGSAIYLYRVVNGKLYGYAKTVVSSSGTYSFGIKPGRGTWTFRVFMPATVGNAAGLSAARTFYRV